MGNIFSDSTPEKTSNEKSAVRGYSSHHITSKEKSSAIVRGSSFQQTPSSRNQYGVKTQHTTIPRTKPTKAQIPRTEPTKTIQDMFTAKGFASNYIHTRRLDDDAGDFDDEPSDNDFDGADDDTAVDAFEGRGYGGNGGRGGGGGYDGYRGGRRGRGGGRGTSHYTQSPMTQSQARASVEQCIHDAVIDCLTEKCVSESDARNVRVKYISPQELLRYLPDSLQIDRRKHVKKHHSGQWEICNKNIHCYLGFQVVSTDLGLKQLLKNLLRKRAEKYRRLRGTGHQEDHKEDGDCIICGKSRKIVHPAFNRHICRVSGYFKCVFYQCHGRSFKVGICLLDPMKETPPTRYKCAKCGYVATFVRYDLKQNENKNENENAKHRSDLCEACDIWGDCQQPFVQPSDICDSLWEFYKVTSQWRLNENRDAIVCSFSGRLDDLDSMESTYNFEIKPYVNCARVNVSAYSGISGNDDGGDDGVDDIVTEKQNLEHFSRSQKYEKPPQRVDVCFKCNEEGHLARDCPLKDNGRVSNKKCYRCGDIGHFARDCDVINNDKCNRCGEIGHWARDCVATNDGYGYGWDQGQWNDDEYYDGAQIPQYDGYGYDTDGNEIQYDEDHWNGEYDDQCGQSYYIKSKDPAPN